MTKMSEILEIHVLKIYPFNGSKSVKNCKDKIIVAQIDLQILKTTSLWASHRLSHF